METKIKAPPGDAFCRLIADALAAEAKQVCTPDIGEKMWANISNRIGLTTEGIPSKKKTE